MDGTSSTMIVTDSNGTPQDGVFMYNEKGSHSALEYVQAISPSSTNVVCSSTSTLVKVSERRRACFVLRTSTSFRECCGKRIRVIAIIADYGILLFVNAAVHMAGRAKLLAEAPNESDFTAPV